MNMSLNDSRSLERTLEYCDKSNNSYLDTTDCSIPNISISTVATGCPSNVKAISNQDRITTKSHIHMNTLWSVWYGIFLTFFQGYLIILGLQKYIGCSLLTWKNGLPVTELNMQLIFCGLTLLFLPLFLASALFKIGNLANDGVKLSARKGTCSSDPPLFEDDGNNSTMKSLWMHGVPISVFIHIITALCLLLPHLLLEAKLIQSQHLPKDNIWKSEIDFLLNRSDRLVILSFINTAPYQNDTNTNENHFDNSVESLDYDLNPFETHESLQSPNTPTENIQSILTGSSPIQISSFSDEDDYFLEDITTQRATTYRTTTTVRRTTPMTSTTTQSTTEVQIFTEPTTMLTTTTTLPTTTKTASTTTTTALPIEISTTRAVVLTNSPIVTEKIHHSGRNKSKNRKHNHKKHHKTHPPIHELDDVDDANQEFKIEDFDAFDQELLRQESNKTNKKKHRNNQKSSQEQIRSTTKGFDSMERPRMTQKVMTEAPKPTAAKSKSKDSNIHIVKPENLPEFTIALTTVTTNSKIVDIKPKATDEMRSIDKRSIEDEQFDESDEVLLLDNSLPSINEDAYIIKEEKNDDVISPQALVGSVPNFTHSSELEGIGGYLQSIVGVNDKFDPKLWFQKSPSLEFINLALALLVWSVRYPSVFWESSKAFSMIFSLQMIANSIDILMLHVGTGILFKLQIVGQFMTVQNQPSPLLLNGIVTLALTLLAYVLIISSSMILYLYGHSRLSAKIRDCQMITLKDGDIWSYFSHCASLCFILALSVVKAPIIHDLCVTYRISLDGTIFASAMTSIIHVFLWIAVWLALTAKRRWAFKLPVIESIYQSRAEAIQPLLTSQNGRQINFTGPQKQEEETIYWPSSPKLKVTFNDEVPSTLNDHNLIEHDGKRPILSTICAIAGEADEGEYATLKNNVVTQLHISEYDEVINLQRMQNDNGYDDTSEEGKLLACVQDESVTYASTRDIVPPRATSSIYASSFVPMVASDHRLMSPMAPVTVQVHSEHTSTPRFLRRADSGMPTNEALTPKSDNSTESSTSPPERTSLSESSSGVHSGEENKEEVVIRQRPVTGLQKIVKTPAVIQEEPYGRITCNMKMSSFKDAPGSASNTLPLSRGSSTEQAPMDYSQCSTMPLMPGAHQMNRMSVNDSPKQRTTLPNNIRYSSGGGGHYLRQMPQLQNAESPYATGLGSGHHTFSSRLIQNEPLPPPPHPMTQSHSQQQFGMTSSSIHHLQSFNTSSSSFTGMNPRSYQMVVNELCANNQTGPFPPPPPPIAHNTLQMH